MVHVLINGLLLINNYSGVQYSIEYFIDSLGNIKSADHIFTVLVSKNYTGSLSPAENLIIRRVGFDSADRAKRIWFENFSLPKLFIESGFDLYHSLGYTLPIFSRIPSIVTVHDLIALDFPAFCKNETAIYYNAFIPRSLSIAKKIIAVSNTVKTDILSKFPDVPEHKVEVVYHGLHKRFSDIDDWDPLITLRAKYNLPDDFFLFVGNIEPKKNLSNLIKAFLYLKTTHKIGQKLLIVGAKGWKYTEVMDFWEHNLMKNEIVFLGYVQESDLPGIYSLAQLFIFPSFYEGFGLPVIEAMACGCPVIISDRGALPEISGGLCEQVNPDCVTEIAHAILKIIRWEVNRRTERVALGKGWSKGFTWEAAGAKALRIYTSVYNSLLHTNTGI